MEIENQSSGDVSQESSSPAPVTTDNSQSASDGQSQANVQHNESASTPFHEHPRWKELMEERNQFRNSATELQRKMAEMEQRLQASQPKPTDPKAQLLERLKGIDPEFGGTFEELYRQAMKAGEVEKQFKEYQLEQTRQAAMQSLKQLHETNKVSNELRPLYEAQIRQLASDPRIGLDDLPRIYNQVHSAMSQVIEGIKRSERESYSKAKAVDSKVPTAPKNPAKPATSNSKQELPKNRDDAKRLVISRAVEAIRAQKASENS